MFLSSSYSFFFLSFFFLLDRQSGCKRVMSRRHCSVSFFMSQCPPAETFGNRNSETKNYAFPFYAFRDVLGHEKTQLTIYKVPEKRPTAHETLSRNSYLVCVFDDIENNKHFRSKQLVWTIGNKPINQTFVFRGCYTTLHSVRAEHKYPDLLPPKILASFETLSFYRQLNS